MSKRDKPFGIQPDVTSITRMMLSSASTTGEKTEDDVGDEMDISMQCDGCKKLIEGLPRLNVLPCGHWYCLICFHPNTENNKHDACQRNSTAISAFLRESSPIQMADHDGELSGDTIKANTDPNTVGTEESKTACTRTPKKRAESGRKRKRRSQSAAGREQMWYFTYASRPVVVSVPVEATYADLLNRLHLMLNLDPSNHQIRLKVQKSSSEHSEGGDPDLAGEPVTLEVKNPKIRLTELKIPRQKMLILEVKKRKSCELDVKKEPKKEEDSDDKKPAVVDERMSMSQSRAEEPKEL